MFSFSTRRYLFALWFRLEGPAFRHVVVTRQHEIYGVLRINTGLRRAVSQSDSDITNLGRWRSAILSSCKKTTSRLVLYPASEAARCHGGRSGERSTTRPGSRAGCDCERAHCGCRGEKHQDISGVRAAAQVH